MEYAIGLAADGLLVLVLLIAVFTLFFRVPSGAKRYDIYSRIIMAGVSSYMFAKLVALVFQPDGLRPFEKLGLEPGAAYLDNPGFPSDHALFAVFLTLAVWFAIRDRRIAIIMATLTIVMSLSRVLALVHTPLDIAGGFVFAFMGALWYLNDGSKLLFAPSQIRKKVVK